MPKQKIPTQVIPIRCQFQGLTIKKHGFIELRFDVDEQDIAAASRILLIKDRKAVAVAKQQDSKAVIGSILFGGWNVKPNGDSTIKLLTTTEDIRTDIGELDAFKEDYLTLRVVT